MEKNQIDATAVIDARVRLGVFNRIGKNVQIKVLDPRSNATVIIGDNNIINDNTRILVTDGHVSIGDWNVFHNDMLIMGGQSLRIGHNCWVGQNTILDGSGKLTLGNGVRIGMYSQLWTHVASGELIEGCLLHGFRETVVEDDVWLVGSCLVGSGVRIGSRTIVLSQSNITKNLKPNSVYAGSPAIEKPTLNFYKKVSIEEKFAMMRAWVNEFIAIKDGQYELVLTGDRNLTLQGKSSTDGRIVVGSEFTEKREGTTYFDLERKAFNKNNSPLERDFYKFIYGNKARFIPE